MAGLTYPGAARRHPVQALAAVGRAAHDAEGARRAIAVEQAVVGDPLQQVDRLARAPAGPGVAMNPSGWGPEVLGEAARRRSARSGRSAGPGRGRTATGCARPRSSSRRAGCPGRSSPREVEERVEQVPPEHVAGHVLGRRHLLQGRVREELARQQGVRELEAGTVGQVRADLERVAQTELPVRQPGPWRTTR